MSAYQLSKARKIARHLIEVAAKTKQETTRAELARIAARLSNDEWRTVAFSAGVAVADLPAKSAVLDILRKRAPHVVGERKEVA